VRRRLGDGGGLGLEGRVALVTGATRGLGLAVARKLCTSGCDVYLNYCHNNEDAEWAVRSLEGLKGSASVLRADVSQPGAIARLTESIVDERGGLDVFVHNVARWHPMPAAEPVVADLHADLAMALDPLLHGITALKAAMAENGGRIVAVSSVGAQRVIPGYVSLGVAKAALENLVRYLAADLAADGIAVNAVSTAKLDKASSAKKSAPYDLPTALLAARTPAGRLTVPADVADVVALLCTDEAAWIRGQVLLVDGGLGLRV
jgi:enoyl-[acyl-carrier protein] reductase III